MYSIARILLACSLLFAANARADAVFNLRASFGSGYYVAGTVRIDPATGLVTGETSTLYRDGIALSDFGAPGSQGPFAPGGLAASYLFSSAGTNGYLFVGAVPGTSLVGYAGGELCGTAAAIHCAFSDVFSGGVPVANVVQGVLAPVTDTIRIFDLAAVFANGDRLAGTVTIDTTIGFVLDEHATLFSGGVVVDTFYNPLGQSVFAPGGLTPSYLFQSVGSNGVLLNIGTPGGSLIGYGGGNICATGTALNCAFSDIFLSSSLSSDAVTGQLTLQRATAVAEPGSFVLIAMGALVLLVRRRRDPDRANRGASDRRRRAGQLL
ncbi:MAG: hypothetical protein ABI277_15040 [Burkholderiaceae bacterium]